MTQLKQVTWRFIYMGSDSDAALPRTVGENHTDGLYGC